MPDKDNRPPRRICITGASGGIGAALAEAYADVKVVLYLHGRNTEKIAAVAERCRARGAEIRTACFDLRDETAVRGWLREVTDAGPVDLAILTAGVNISIGPDKRGENWAEAETLIDVNLKATMLVIDCLLPSMRARSQGQIAIFSSLAGYFGLPLVPSYCASKAALKAYGEALRGWLAPEGVKINVVMPGYVESAMCENMPGPKPFLLTPQRAAGTIREGLRKNKPRITFPFPLNVGTWLLAVLPASLSHTILRWLGYAGD